MVYIYFVSLPHNWQN